MAAPLVNRMQKGDSALEKAPGLHPAAESEIVALVTPVTLPASLPWTSSNWVRGIEITETVRVVPVPAAISTEMNPEGTLVVA